MTPASIKSAAEPSGDSVHDQRFDSDWSDTRPQLKEEIVNRATPSRTWGLFTKKARRVEKPRRAIKKLYTFIVGLFSVDVNPARPIPEERPRPCPFCGSVWFPDKKEVSR